MTVQSIDVMELFWEKILGRRLLLLVITTSPDLRDGKDGSKFSSSFVHSSFSLMNPACEPSVDISRWILSLWLWCIDILECFLQ